ncbi:MAG: MFS transporter [Pyrinomonadaceae bacterium]
MAIAKDSAGIVATGCIDMTSKSVNGLETQLRRAFWGVMASFLVHGLVVSTWISRIASLKAELKLSDGALGLALLGAAIGSITTIPICGWLVTKYGSRRSAKWTSLGLCLALVLPALSWNAGTLFAALLVFGALAGANDVAMNAQGVVTEKLRGTPTMSRFHAMFSLGGILGASAGGLLAASGISPLTHLASGAICFLFLAILVSGLTVETHESEPRTEKRVPIKRIPLTLVALSAIGFCIFLSEGAIADWAAVYLRQELGAGEGLAAAGYAVFSAAMALFRFGGDAITAWIGEGVDDPFGRTHRRRRFDVSRVGSIALLGAGRIRSGRNRLLVDHSAGLCSRR